MNDLKPILAAVGSVLFFIKTLDVLYIFQTKEYRLDRFFSHLKEESPFFVFYVRNIRFPARKARNIGIALYSLVVSALFFAVFQRLIFSHMFIAALFIPVLSFLTVFTAILATNIVAKLKRSFIIERASKLLVDSSCVFIGITGSYGKTSTKEFLYEILSSKYKAGKTERNMNTDVGIALSVLKNLKKDTRFFIAEMGAYKKGEIKKACDLVKPTFGVMTTIGNQHISLFGSKKNLIEAKSELLEALPKKGSAYINADIKETGAFIKKTKAKVCLFSTSQKTADIYAFEIKTHKDKTTFKARYKNNIFSIETSLIGEHNVQNLLPCIALASDLKFEKKEIEKAILGIKQVENKLSVHKGVNKSTILSDANNSNVEGFIAAIKVASKMPFKNKFVVSKGIIELGPEKKHSYRKIVNALNQSDLQLYTTDYLFKSFDTKNKVRQFSNEKELLKSLSRKINNKTLLVVEGRFSNKFLSSVFVK